VGHDTHAVSRGADQRLRQRKTEADRQTNRQTGHREKGEKDSDCQKQETETRRETGRQRERALVVGCRTITGGGIVLSEDLFGHGQVEEALGAGRACSTTRTIEMAYMCTYSPRQEGETRREMARERDSRYAVPSSAAESCSRKIFLVMDRSKSPSGRG
jgi:hypothetical protein